MNDDDFEKKLEALTGALRRPDPTPQWKADILARARSQREADESPAPSPAGRLLPPRWLMAAWGAAWVLIALMHFTTPAGGSNGATAAGNAAILVNSSTKKQEPGATVSQTLVAYQFTVDRYLKLP